MPKFKVLLTDYAWPDVQIERRVLAEVDAELIVAEHSDAASLAALAVDVDAILTNWAQVPAAVIEAAPGCQIISRLGIGIDNIDVPCATRRNILVTNVPDYCLVEVAEHALALLFALGRKVAFYHYQTKSLSYDLQAGAPLKRIEGQTLGIVGLGHIGRCFAKKAMAVGLKVLASDPAHDHPLPGVAWRSLDDLLAQSDYVSLHAPATQATRNMIAAPQLARMRRGAYLINTSRGALIDETALAHALQSGHLAGAALDVQQQEPPDLSQPPFNDPRVIVTPHVSFNSVESVAELRRRAARQVADRLAGGVPPNVVNPAALKALGRS